MKSCLNIKETKINSYPFVFLMQMKRLAESSLSNKVQKYSSFHIKIKAFTKHFQSNEKSPLFSFFNNNSQLLP